MNERKRKYWIHMREENGNLSGFPQKVRQRYQKIAKATMAKDKRVNIRIASRDLEAIQARAIEDGIPYQTLMSSVLHKFVTGKLVEKNNVAK